MVYMYLFPSIPEEAEGGSVVCDSTAVYRPRNAEESILYSVVAENLETFLSRQWERDRPVPRFVERELRLFLNCGIPALGFLRVHCDTCGEDRIVPFSCKGRGFCNSCGGRRMADTAAHLVDRVFPEVPVRQWVLSLPFSLRYRLAYDARLVSEVLRIFVQAVFRSLAGRAREHAGVLRSQCGAVTFVQRFGGALNLNVHFHMLVLDGVYGEDDGQTLRFHRLAQPSDAEVAQVAARVARRIARLLHRRGLGPQANAEEADSLNRDEPLLAALYGASVSGRTGRTATGPRAGMRVATMGDQIDVETPEVLAGPRCASVSGVNVHANVSVAARDRMGLERLCRYAGRPPVAIERLSLLPDGRLLYRLKRRWRNGTTHVIFEPLELIEKLAALVPAPRFNLVRYHGVFAPAAKWRADVVPADPPSDSLSHRGCRRKAGMGDILTEAGCLVRQRAWSRPRNYSWAELLHRVFFDRCSRMRQLWRPAAYCCGDSSSRSDPENSGLPRHTFPGATDCSRVRGCGGLEVF